MSLEYLPKYMIENKDYIPLSEINKDDIAFFFSDDGTAFVYYLSGVPDKITMEDYDQLRYEIKNKGFYEIITEYTCYYAREGTFSVNLYQILTFGWDKSVRINAF